MSCDEPTHAIVTAFITGDPHWTVIPIGGNDLMMQDCASNVALIGSRAQLATMIERMCDALEQAVTQTPKHEMKVPAHVNGH